MFACRHDQQVEGVNYQNTFSLVMDMTTARIIFAFGVIWGNPPTYPSLIRVHLLKTTWKSNFTPYERSWNLAI
jgi:hypothetical protein